MATSNPFDSYVIRINGDNSGRVALLLCYNEGAFAGRIDFYADGEDNGTTDDW